MSTRANGRSASNRRSKHVRGLPSKSNLVPRQSDGKYVPATNTSAEIASIKCRRASAPRFGTRTDSQPLKQTATSGRTDDEDEATPTLSSRDISRVVCVRRIEHFRNSHDLNSTPTLHTQYSHFRQFGAPQWHCIVRSPSSYL